MTKKERTYYINILMKVRFVREDLVRGMRDFDCTWPDKSVKELDEALKYLELMKPKSKE